MTASENLCVQEHVDLQPLNTFHVPAKARWFARARTADDLQALLADPRFAGLPVFVLGGGSNTLFTRGWEGLVIRPAMEDFELLDENDSYRFVRLGAGLSWSEVVERTLALGWPGLENLALIPGTVGGAVVQNIGAYGLEIAERVSEVEAWDRTQGKMRTFFAADCDFSYRSSLFKKSARGCVVTAVTLALPKEFRPVVGYKELAARFADAAPSGAREVADAVIAVRRRKLPDPAVLGSAGSFFKNPVVPRVKLVHLLEDDPRLVSYPMPGGNAKLAAGWLIDHAGCRGLREGDAAVFERHSLVLINHGQATGAQVLALSQRIAQAVRARFGVTLEPEPVIV